MACDRSDDVLRLESLSEAERASFLAHLPACADCRRTKALLDGTRSTLASSQRELSPAGRVAMREGLDARLVERSYAPWFVAALATAASIALVVWLSPHTPEPPARPIAAAPMTKPIPMAVRKGSELVIDGGRITIEEDASLVVVRGPGLVDLELEAGALLLDVEAGSAFVVSTPSAEVRTSNSRLRVIASRVETRIEVERGSASLGSKDGASRRVGPGERATLPPAELAIAESPREEPRAVDPVIHPAPRPARRKAAVPPKAEAPEPIDDPTPPIPVPSRTEVAKVEIAKVEEVEEIEIEERDSDRMRRADGLRRSGDLDGALEAYAGIGTSSSFAEEARYLEAQIHHRRHEIDRAIEALGRVSSTKLLPERTALLARLLSSDGRHGDAIDAIEASMIDGFEIQSTRIAIGREALASDARVARRAVEPLLASANRGLRVRALHIAIEAAHQMRDEDREEELRLALEKIQ